MSEIFRYAFNSIDRHEEAIHKLAKSNRSMKLMIVCLAGYTIYQAIKMNDLSFDMMQMKKRERDRMEEEAENSCI